MSLGEGQILFNVVLSLTRPRLALLRLAIAFCFSIRSADIGLAIVKDGVERLEITCLCSVCIVNVEEIQREVEKEEKITA